MQNRISPRFQPETVSFGATPSKMPRITLNPKMTATDSPAVVATMRFAPPSTLRKIPQKRS